MDNYIKSCIAETKKSLCQQLDVEKVFDSVRESMLIEVDAILDKQARGEPVIPVLHYADIARDSVPGQSIEAVRHCGCAIITGVYSAQQAHDWNQQIGEYLDTNHYLDKSREKAGMDNYFGDLADASPQIFGIYWSRPQIEARQAESMAMTKRFLNRIWDVRSPMGDEFDPEHDYAYADRTRRRAPGDKTLGLSPHMDAGSYERWVDPAFQKIYQPIFSGHWQQYDPWKAAYRTQTREYKSPAVCSMFRTFQGWTALTPQGAGDGTLQLLPLANSIVYTLLRSLMPDIPADQFCIAQPGRALGINAKWHPDLIRGLVSIPEVEPGDTLWWHPDVIHAVEAEHNGSNYASVIYIGASPRCAKNEAYARRQAVHFLAGKSAPDFAAEDYEADFNGRAGIDDLTALGREQMLV